MAILSKEQLYGKVAEAVTADGWQIQEETDKGQQPVRIIVSKEKELLVIRIYIWNLTHGGASRPENEFRIQVKVDRFEEESNSKTLILGYSDDMKLFVGFDVSKHIGKPGWSASMQIKKEYLEEAAKNGIAAYSKENGEIAIAFRPEFFIEYTKESFDLHSNGNLNKYLSSGDDKLTPIVDDSEGEDVPFRFSISSYGADYPVDAIVQRISNDVIFVPPFQRRFVWNIKEASRFIESLILGLPVPGIFLSKEASTNRLLIIDGQQRLFSLYSFYSNNFKNKPFQLQGVQEDLLGRTIADLDAADRTRLNDSIIHATVIKQDEPNNDQSSIYLIFERLNSSGRLLTPQEVRACVYYGDFNEYLNKIILKKEWRDIFGRMNERMKEQELILRFFALAYYLNAYKKPLKSFLNFFMENNRNLENYTEDNLNQIFLPPLEIFHSLLGKTAFRAGSGVNAAIFDATMIGLSKRIAKAEISNLDDVKKAYDELLQDKKFIDFTREGTADDTSVKNRIGLAIEKFDSIK